MLPIFHMLSFFSDDVPSKLKWYGHVTRSSGLAKTVLQGTEGDEEADRGNDGKTTSKSGLALNGIYSYGKLRTARSGGSWL